MLIEDRSRRSRLKLWMALLLPILAAGPILAWCGINPFRRDPAAIAIESEAVWAAEGTGRYISEQTPIEGGRDSLDIKPYRANCVVKFSYLAPWTWGPPEARNETSYFFRRGWVTQNGSCMTLSRVSNATQGGGISGDLVKLARCRAMVAKLPPAHRWVDPHSALVVGSLQKGTWEVRTYDRDRLPAEVAELLEICDQSSSR